MDNQAFNGQQIPQQGFSQPQNSAYPQAQYQQVPQYPQVQYQQAPVVNVAADPTTLDAPLEDEDILGIAPSNPSGWQVMGKMGIGLVVGFLISLLIFLVIFMLGAETFTDAANSLLPLILILIAFVCTFIGNVMVMGAYSLFYSVKYYDFGKMFSAVLLSSGILFFLFAAVYMMANSGADTTIFVVLAFHVLFSIFISYTMIEFITNPNYSGSSLMGTVIGFSLCMVIYLFIYNATKTQPEQVKLYYLMLLPAILSYTIVPFVHAIWEKVYYKFYEMGNNFFYIPSLSEVTHRDDDTNTEMEGNQNDEDDVNVEL